MQCNIGGNEGLGGGAEWKVLDLVGKREQLDDDEITVKKRMITNIYIVSRKILKWDCIFVDLYDLIALSYIGIQ